MAYTTIDDPSAHFQTAIYTGNGGSLAVTNDGNSDLQPDLVWIKVRSLTSSHAVHDTSRGRIYLLTSNTTANDDDGTNAAVDEDLVSFDSDGITLGTAYHGRHNTNTATYVAWQWKANGGTRTTFTESGDNPAGGYQANTTAGFSIIDYTGTGANGTVAHGLGVAPKCIIIKRRNDTESWIVGHDGIVLGTGRLQLDTTAANGTGNADAYYNTTAPSSTVVSLGDHDAVNGNDDTYIIYAFAPIQGYSKFGSYTGNGNADGVFVYTGFKPAWVMIKKTSGTEDWGMLDNKRSSSGGNNVIDDFLYANQNFAEVSSQTPADFLSNGFKIRSSDNKWNLSTGTYIYMAFAEQPLVTSGGVPCTAR